MDLTQEFEAEIKGLITTTLKETSYRPTYFMEMVAKQGAMDATLQLVRKTQPSDGFTKLWELKRLELTVEAVVIQDKYKELFLVDDLEKAKRRLKEYGYKNV